MTRRERVSVNKLTLCFVNVVTVTDLYLSLLPHSNPFTQHTHVLTNKQCRHTHTHTHIYIILVQYYSTAHVHVTVYRCTSASA